MKRYLLGSDFDQTLFQTFQPSPNKLSVPTAYHLALGDILGQKGQFFGKYFLNHAPGELVAEVFKWYRPPEQLKDDDKAYRSGIEEAYQELIGSALAFYQREGEAIASLIPEGRGGGITWDKDNPLKTITTLLVGKKLHYLMTEVGQKDAEGNIWPMPCNGAAQFWRTATTLRQEGVPLDIAVISSGHDAFINKTFDVWDLERPQVLVTDDDVRPLSELFEPERRYKPGTLPIELAHGKWLIQQGVENPSAHATKESKRRMMYIGDDIHKDLGMAIYYKVEGYVYPYTSWEAIAN